ncbi:MAG: hypothetical protein K6A44_00385 [bacterium]|nr:hypothetical protein [bacterium]
MELEKKIILCNDLMKKSENVILRTIDSKLTVEDARLVDMCSTWYKF